MRREKVHWITEGLNKDQDYNNGYIYGIYTYQNDEIVNVSWFNCENQRDYYFKGTNEEVNDDWFRRKSLQNNHASL